MPAPILTDDEIRAIYKQLGELIEKQRWINAQLEDVLDRLPPMPDDDPEDDVHVILSGGDDA